LTARKLHDEYSHAVEREPGTLPRVLTVAERRHCQHRLPQRLFTNTNLHVIGNSPNLVELPLHPRRVDPASDWLHICNLLSDERMARVALSDDAVPPGSLPPPNSHHDKPL